MTLERSHGKMRPGRVRAHDLIPPKSVVKPPSGRDANGNFAPGNRIGVGARWKNTVRKALGSTANPGTVGIVARDAARVMAHVLRSLPSDAPPVRVLVAIHARHVALNAYFTAAAEAAGLDTPEGRELLAVADRQSQRAERTLVTALDVARVSATREQPLPGPTWAALAAPDPEDPPEDPLHVDGEVVP